MDNDILWDLHCLKWSEQIKWRQKYDMYNEYGVNCHDFKTEDDYLNALRQTWKAFMDPNGRYEKKLMSITIQISTNMNEILSINIKHTRTLARIETEIIII